MADNEKYKLTETHFGILNFIVKFKIQYDGISPSIREIMRACNISSLSVTQYQLDALEHHGKIKRLPRTSRGIMVVGGKWGLLISHMVG